jgi:GTP cyclohydrolase I
MLVKETLWGLDPKKFPKVMTLENKMNYSEMLIERDISVMSQCEHHFVTIEGRCHIAYIPKDVVMGLSKFNRVVEYFSRRPQVQERLTAQIFETLKMLLETENVAVVIEAKHYCVISRGVEDGNSETISSSLGGDFRQPAVRAEFLSLVSGKR